MLITHQHKVIVLVCGMHVTFQYMNTMCGGQIMVDPNFAGRVNQGI
jgi:hypothetical protein